MSNTSPPNYPLINAEVPSSCQVKEDKQNLRDNVSLNSLIYLLKDPLNNSHKKRTSDENQTTRALNEIKKRLTVKNDDVLAQESSPVKEFIKDYDLIESDGEASDFSLRESDTTAPANKITGSDTPQVLSPLTINQTSVSTALQSFEASDLPLPSPSASPKESNYTENDIEDDTVIRLDDDEQVSSLSLIDVIENIASTALSKGALNNLIFRLLTQTDRKTLSDIRNTIDNGLKRDFLTNLPLEVGFKILKYLDYKTLNNVLLVSKSWNKLITGEFWKNLLLKDNLITDAELDDLEKSGRNTYEMFHSFYIKRHNLYKNWVDPSFEPKRITVPGHGPNVVTCLQLDDEKIITTADDRMINVYNPNNGELIKILKGHEGGVWALKYIGNQIISGSTDRTVRVWNLTTGKCTHVFRGHTSTIRCLDIVTDDETGERFIVTGARDHNLHVWRLPDEDDDGSNFDEHDSVNPYFVTVLKGHTAPVRAVTGNSNIVISGSYDHTVRVWDLRTKSCLFVLRGHTDRIYSIVFDIKRNKCISASMDSTIRVWDLSTGECVNELNRHTSLVGLLGLSSDYLVSAAADGTLRGWDPSNYDNIFTLHHDHHAAITTFHATPNILVSGSEGQFNIYDLKSKGKLIRSNLLTDCEKIWSTKFNHSKCIVAVEKNAQSYIEILDFSRRT